MNDNNDQLIQCQCCEEWDYPSSDDYIGIDPLYGLCNCCGQGNCDCHMPQAEQEFWDDYYND